MYIKNLININNYAVYNNKTIRGNSCFSLKEYSRTGFGIDMNFVIQIGIRVVLVNKKLEHKYGKVY